MAKSLLDDEAPAVAAPEEPGKRRSLLDEDTTTATPGAGLADAVSRFVPEKNFLGPEGSSWTDLGADVAKSAGIGAAHAVIGIAGMPGDVFGQRKQENINREAAAPSDDPFEAAAARQRAAVVRRQGTETPPDQEGVLPGSQGIQNAIETVTGPFYKPQSGAGELAKYGVNAALTPGGPMRKAAAVVGPALGEYVGRGVGGEEGAAIGAVAGGLPTSFGKSKYPTIDALDARSSLHYNVARSLGSLIEIKPQSLAQVLDDLTNPATGSLRRRGSSILSEEGVHAKLKQLGEQPNPDAGLVMEAVKELRNKGSAGTHAADKLTDYLSNLGPGDAKNWQHTPGFMEEFKNGDIHYRAARTGEEIEKAFEKGMTQSAVTGAGANVQNALRQKANQLLNSPQAKYYKPEQLDSLKRIAEGTYTGNALRFMGKFGPSGALSTFIGTSLLSAITGGNRRLIASGLELLYGARKGAESVTKRQFKNLSKEVRGDTPLGQEPQFGAKSRVLLPAAVNASIAREAGEP